MISYVLLLQAVLVTLSQAERITCLCNIGQFAIGECDIDNNSCEFNEGNGACIAYYHQNTTLLQFCGRGLLKKLTCMANDGVYFAEAGTRGVCCFEDNCNSQEALNNLFPTSAPSSQNSTAPLPSKDPTQFVLSTSEPIRTSSSTPNSQPNSTTEQSTSSDSSPPVYAIALSVILPLIIITIFAIAMIMFLMYMRLYIKHNREKSPSENELSQIY